MRYYSAIHDPDESDAHSPLNSVFMSLLALAGLAHRLSPPRLAILGISPRARRPRGGGSQRFPCPECHQPGMLTLVQFQSCARTGRIACGDGMDGEGEDGHEYIYQEARPPLACGRKVVLRDSVPTKQGVVYQQGHPLYVYVYDKEENYGDGELYCTPAPRRPAQPESVSPIPTPTLPSLSRRSLLRPFATPSLVQSRLLSAWLSFPSLLAGLAHLRRIFMRWVTMYILLLEMTSSTRRWRRLRQHILLSGTLGRRQTLRLRTGPQVQLVLE